MAMSSAGLRPEKVCAGEVQQQLKTTDPTSRQIGRSTSRNLYLKVGCLHPVACIRSGSGFPSIQNSVALDGNPEPNLYLSKNYYLKVGCLHPVACTRPDSLYFHLKMVIRPKHVAVTE
jgi:hypothetical protein